MPLSQPLYVFAHTTEFPQLNWWAQKGPSFQQRHALNFIRKRLQRLDFGKLAQMHFLNLVGMMLCDYLRWGMKRINYLKVSLGKTIFQDLDLNPM